MASDDDVYASYFRPDPPDIPPSIPPDLPPAPAAVPAAAPEPAPEPDPVAEQGEVEPVAEPVVEGQPAPTLGQTDEESSADTGRLFRSQGVVGHEVAVLALASDHGGRLRTLSRERDENPSPGDSTADSPDAPDGTTPEPKVRRERGARGSHRSGISAGAVYIIVFGLTLIVAFVNAWLASGTLGWPTGVALVVASVYCALRVRREDDIVAMLVPPLAFFVAAITAGQLLLGAQAGSLLNRAQKAFFTLADNWFWIIGATLAAVIIILVRRRRA